MICSLLLSKKSLTVQLICVIMDWIASRFSFASETGSLVWCHLTKAFFTLESLFSTLNIGDSQTSIAQALLTILKKSCTLAQTLEYLKGALNVASACLEKRFGLWSNKPWFRKEPLKVRDFCKLWMFTKALSSLLSIRLEPVEELDQE